MDFSTRHMASPFEYNKQYSDRELEVLLHFSKGLTAKEIAAAMNLSVGTIRTHRQNILSKSNEKKYDCRRSKMRSKRSHII